MTVSAPLAEDAEDDGTVPESGVTAVADSFTTLLRAFTRARSQFLARTAQDVEWTAYTVLRCLAVEGPLRSSALAELVELDASTISRQVARLTDDGLIERRADPQDGRASLLVLTEAASAVIAKHDAARNSHFGRMLAEWDEGDLRQFADMLQRFTEDFTTIKHEWVEAAAKSPRDFLSTGGKN